MLWVLLILKYFEILFILKTDGSQFIIAKIIKLKLFNSFN